MSDTKDKEPELPLERYTSSAMSLLRVHSGIVTGEAMTEEEMDVVMNYCRELRNRLIAHPEISRRMSGYRET